MKNLQKGFIVPALIIIIAVLAVGGAVYFLSNNKNTGTPDSLMNSNVQLINSNSALALSNSNNQSANNLNTPVSDPKIAFISIRAELENAQEINSYLAILLRTSAEEKRAEIEKGVNAMTAVSKSSGDVLAAFKGSTIPISAITIKSVKIDGNTAILNGSFSFARDNSQFKGLGTVTMKKEGGAWKVYLEKWNF